LQAQEQAVPAYVIFNDATLLQLVTQVPQSFEALSRIVGIGAKKLERYGHAILEIIRTGSL